MARTKLTARPATGAHPPKKYNDKEDYESEKDELSYESDSSLSEHDHGGDETGIPIFENHYDFSFDLIKEIGEENLEKYERFKKYMAEKYHIKTLEDLEITEYTVCPKEDFKSHEYYDKSSLVATRKPNKPLIHFIPFYEVIKKISLSGVSDVKLIPGGFDERMTEIFENWDDEKGILKIEPDEPDLNWSLFFNGLDINASDLYKPKYRKVMYDCASEYLDPKLCKRGDIVKIVSSIEPCLEDYEIQDFMIENVTLPNDKLEVGSGPAQPVFKFVEYDSDDHKTIPECFTYPEFCLSYFYGYVPGNTYHINFDDSEESRRIIKKVLKATVAKKKSVIVRGLTFVYDVENWGNYWIKENKKHNFILNIDLKSE